MKALELMKTHVVKTSPGATLEQAVDLMDLYRVNVLPVIGADERLCGILAESDISRAVITHRGELDSSGSEPAERRTCPEIRCPTLTSLKAAAAAGRYLVSDYMSAAGRTVMESQDVADTVPMLFSNQIEPNARVFVLDGLSRVVGTIDRIDLYQAVFEGAL